MIALAFSGGKDSMACLHLLREELDCAIYVDTGASYPETREMVDYAKDIVDVHIVRTGRQEQDGIPSDVVPVNWTKLGVSVTHKKPVLVQSYIECCLHNIAEPLMQKAAELGVTEIVCGQRNEEGHKSTSRDGDVVLGIKRRHPIEDWSEKQVFDFLAQHMRIPDHYRIKHSSLDCYDCTAYRHESKDRLEWTKDAHPAFYAAYLSKKKLLDGILNEALNVNSTSY